MNPRDGIPLDTEMVSMQLQVKLPILLHASHHDSTGVGEQNAS